MIRTMLLIALIYIQGYTTALLAINGPYIDKEWFMLFGAALMLSIVYSSWVLYTTTSKH